MKNKVADGKSLVVAAAADVVSGAGVLVGATFGVALNAALTGETCVLDLEGVFSLPKATGAWTQGAKIYWDNTAKNVTTTTGSNTLIGVAYEAAASGDTAGKVRLNGSF